MNTQDVPASRGGAAGDKRGGGNPPVPAAPPTSKKPLTGRQLVEGARRRLAALRPRRTKPEELSPAQQRWAAIKAMPRPTIRPHAVLRPTSPLRNRKVPKVVTARARQAQRDSTRSSRARRDRAAALNSTK